MEFVDYYNARPGHVEWCLANFGPSESSCDCGGFEKKERIAAILRCNHEFVGFRSSKLCKHCGQTRAELKNLKEP